MAADGRTGQSPAVFGDFWRQAARLASPPPYPDPPAGAEQVRHITLAASQVVAVMRRYVGDIASAGAGARNSLWANAIARARIATTLIIGGLRQETAPAPAFPPGSFASRLDGYATALTYGRDLLHTHLATTAHGERCALSDWAPVISSAALNRALLAGLADHAQAIAGQLTGLRLAGPPTLTPSRHGSVSRAQPGSCGNSARPYRLLSGRRRCLWSIASCWRLSRSTSCPSCRRRRRRRRSATCARASSAPRSALTRPAGSSPPELHGLRNSPQTRCAMPPPTTSWSASTLKPCTGSWRCALASSAMTPSFPAWTLAADRADDSRRAWLAVAHVWDNMVTDSRAYLSRPAAEAGHLALWTGRLAYADPAWTPARRPSHAVRDPASLAPGPAALAEVASAMHYATDSLARAARTDLDTVRTAASAGRLYVTTRSLPELKYDVPRPYADAPRDRLADAFAVYADTADISQAALRSAADVAAAVEAPSQVLSIAEQATAEPVVAPRGRLEQHLLDLGVRDAELLRQGVELDQRAQRLLSRASGQIRPPGR